MTATKYLSRALESRPGQANIDDDGDIEMTDGEDDIYDDDDEDDDFEVEEDDIEYDQHFGLSSAPPEASVQISAAEKLGLAMSQRVRRDLRKVRAAGFKIGILCGLQPDSRSSIISMSIRASKLLLSEEALQAWDLDSSDYIILLMRMDGMYPVFDGVLQRPASSFNVEFRFGKSIKYKPSLNQALAAFASSKQTFDVPVSGSISDTDSSQEKFKKLFISSSLEQYMNEAFLSLLKLRNNEGLSWDQANSRFRSMSGGFVAQDEEDSVDLTARTSEASKALPPVLLADHLTDMGERSMPLVAMEFAMRYFVRCNEFCLRCHCLLEEQFEALKPYVCANPLCLFQYMALGLGPSIEHEIVTQPYVVDLLVSFCYAAVKFPAHMNRAWQPNQTPALSHPIREHPVGLRFRVPRMIFDEEDTSFIKVKVDPGFARVKVENFQDMDRLAGKTWVVFHEKPAYQPHRIYHGYITNVDTRSMTLEVKQMGMSVVDPLTMSSTRAGPAAAQVYGETVDQQIPQKKGPPGPKTMHMGLYEDDFDDLKEDKKSLAMALVLDTLPSIMQIRDHLTRHPHSRLRSYGMVSSAAAALLEWIVASNRSCIFQIEHITEDAPGSPDGTSTHATAAPATTNSASALPIKSRENEKIPGMEGWVQFRFAQGSPDKELRFSRALTEVAARKSLAYPTIFAWHGSRLSNWHSILRHGLDFKEVMNGRAYGNGVYFSQEFSTSSSYAGAGGSATTWPNASLKLSSALSLNEIINAPDEFVSMTPHLVVSQVDWIQCRYLFVQRYLDYTGSYAAYQAKQLSAQAKLPGEQVAKLEPQMLLQDPKRTVKGPLATNLNIPLAAIPSARVSQWQAKNSQFQVRGNGDPIYYQSDEEEPEDLDFLSDWDGKAEAQKGIISRTSSSETIKLCARPLTPAYTGQPLTDFRPGALDLKTLPLLQPPAWATDIARKQIGKEVKKLAEVQSRTHLHELGWYIDIDNMENMFQWIVELHSFEADLPLAKDMKKAGVMSIVLEIRFGREYPISPPFVRVIQPRFLPFMLGGGGHVTGGGAMCMELLTTNGWTPANSMEAVLLQVRMAMCSVDPRPARLERTDGGSRATYGIGEAVDAFTRAAAVHGWTVPNDLRETAGQVGFPPN